MSNDPSKANHFTIQFEKMPLLSPAQAADRIRQEMISKNSPWFLYSITENPAQNNLEVRTSASPADMGIVLSSIFNPAAWAVRFGYLKYEPSPKNPQKRVIYVTPLSKS